MADDGPSPEAVEKESSPSKAGSSSSSSSSSSSRERLKETRAADAVTDYHEEKEADATKAQAALDAVSSSSSASVKELFKGNLTPEDVSLIMDECDLTKEMATQLLQEHEGSTILALKAFIAQGAQ